MNNKHGSKTVRLPFGVDQGSVAANDCSASDGNILRLSSESACRHVGLGCEAGSSRVEPENNETVSLLRLGTPILSAYVADTCVARLKGLFAYPPLCANQALLLSPCAAVHTVGMKYVIDVAFLSRRGLIVKIVKLNPRSFAYCRQAHYAVEMADGTAQRLELQVGQLLDVGL